MIAFCSRVLYSAQRKIRSLDELEDVCEARRPKHRLALAPTKTRMIRPVTQKQIDAALRMHERLAQWSISDNALKCLRDKMPGWSAEESLLKCVAINALYGANVFAITRMAQHVTSALALPPGSADSLVEHVALPHLSQGGTPRRHVSFASKLCHFFICAERYPIYDEAACKALRYHLDAAYCHDDRSPYSAFCRNLEALRTASHTISATARQLDRYLWIVGLYMRYLRWRKAGAKRAPIVNVELLTEFEKRPLPPDLQSILPEGIDGLD